MSIIKFMGCYGKTVCSSKTVVFFVVLLVLVSPKAWAETGPADEKKIKSGKRVYMKYCKICHGETGIGDGDAADISGIVPTDLTNKAYMDLLSDKDLFSRIRYGEDEYPYLQMPGFGSLISTATSRMIIAYVRSIGIDKGPLKGPTPAERAERFKEPKERGRVYYLRYCAPCHGVTGDGKGKMAKSSGGVPVAHKDPKVMAQFTRQMIFAHVKGLRKKKDRNMPVFGKYFTAKKVKEIAAYTKSLALGPGRK